MRRTVRTSGRPEHELLGHILRESREAAGLSQRQMAEKLNRTQAYIWKIEGGFQHVDIPTLLDIASITGREPEDIISQLRSKL